MGRGRKGGRDTEEASDLLVATRRPFLAHLTPPHVVQCFACQEKPACTLLAPIETFTLEKLAEVVLKKELNMAHPELALESGG